MDCLTFISDITRSLAWPIVVVVIVWLLRHSISKLVLTLQKLKYQNLELDFAKQLESAEAKADAAHLPPVRPNVNDQSGDRQDSYLKNLAKACPRAAIGESWRILENEINNTLEQKGIFLSSNRSMSPLRLAKEKKIYPLEYSGLLNDLRAIRNQAVHGTNIDIDLASALEYINLVERFISVMQKHNQTSEQNINSTTD